MALFLNESTLLQYKLMDEKLLSEAVADPEAGTDPKDSKDPKESSDDKTATDVSADAKDAAAVPTDSGDDAPPAGDPPADDSDSGDDEDDGGDDPATPPSSFQTRKTIGGVEVEDTALNRRYLFNQFQEIIKIHENLLEFVTNMTVKFPNDKKRLQLLGQIKEKSEFDLRMLNNALDDQIFVGMDITSLFALYKIYFNDASSALRVIKLVLNYQPIKS
jgi:hypothetical protein